jgi:hypothetical protein
MLNRQDLWRSIKNLTSNKLRESVETYEAETVRIFD